MRFVGAGKALMPGQECDGLFPRERVHSVASDPIQKFMRNYAALKWHLCPVLALAAFASPHVASSAITVDGTRDGDYGPALAVQAVQTQFGDNFSELNAGYARIESGTLYLLLTGNVEGNFNKLNIFFDSKTGGQNSILGDSNPSNDGWAGKYNGFTFDSAFSADYLFILRNGNTQFDLDYAVVGGGGTGFDTYANVFGGTREGASFTAVGPNLGQSLAIGFNNSNTAGVIGGTAAADQSAAAAVTTGIELGIPLVALGNPAPGDTIRISAMVNGGGMIFCRTRSSADSPHHKETWAVTATGTSPAT